MQQGINSKKYKNDIAEIPFIMITFTSYDKTIGFYRNNKMVCKVTG